MKKQLFSFLCAGLMLTACGQQNKQVTTMDFVDNVKVALSDSGHINLDSLQWTREPAACEIKNGTASSGRGSLPHVKSRMIPFASPPLRRPTSGSAPTITSRTTMPPCFR